MVLRYNFYLINFIWIIKLSKLFTGFSFYPMLASYLSLVDGNPVSGGKPLVALDIIDSIPEVAKALGQIHLKQVSQQIL